MLSIFDHIADGVRPVNLLDIVRANPDIFKHICSRGSMFDQTFEKLEEFISEDGSSMKVMEIDAYKLFMDAMEYISHGGVCSINILCFNFIHCCWYYS